MTGLTEELLDDFDAPELDTGRWLPHYLPMWSSRAATAAAYRLADSCLVLEVPGDHPDWLPGQHAPRLRVSGMQSGCRSGPVGSTDGQQCVHEGQRVAEAQPEFRGHLQSGGHLEVRCRMQLSARSMAALWLCGFEERPEESGELCVVEVFGKDLRPGSARVGMGIKPIRDPRLRADFDAPELPIDVAAMHTYAVDWDAAEAVFSVDGTEVRRCPGPPTYPLQVMMGVFDFPEWADGSDEDLLVPQLVVDRVEGRPSGT